MRSSLLVAVRHDSGEWALYNTVTNSPRQAIENQRRTSPTGPLAVFALIADEQHAWPNVHRVASSSMPMYDSLVPATISGCAGMEHTDITDDVPTGHVLGDRGNA